MPTVFKLIDEAGSTLASITAPDAESFSSLAKEAALQQLCYFQRAARKECLVTVTSSLEAMLRFESPEEVSVALHRLRSFRQLRNTTVGTQERAGTDEVFREHADRGVANIEINLGGESVSVPIPLAPCQLAALEVQAASVKYCLGLGLKVKILPSLHFIFFLNFDV